MKTYEFTPAVPHPASLIAYCRSLAGHLATTANGSRDRILADFRQELRSDMRRLCSDCDVASLFIRSVLLDLVAQDWSVDVRGSSIKLTLEPMENETVSENKARVRRAHLLDRDSQLQNRAVSQFLDRMERRHIHPKNGWVSIHNLMRDGRELAEKLASLKSVEGAQERERLQREFIQPYLQFVEGDSVCEHTGFRLMDIWRYFRHTWVNSYKSLPGRSMMILVRDAAVPFHPVIGIAALGSSIVQQSARDIWIGWRGSEFSDGFAPTADNARWALTAVQKLVSQIYIKDLLKHVILRRTDLASPDNEVLRRLREEGRSAIARHRLYPRHRYHKPKNGFDENVNWEERARTDLFRSKRCFTLATLLSIRQTFTEAGLVSGTRSELSPALSCTSFRNALAQLIRMVKAEHVGIDMMDIIVCGAVAPYNVLLGGKLTCLLLCSPEVILHHAEKYEGRISIIASSMAGKPIKRKPRLVLLGTTSLYGFGSSQYNRIKVCAHQFGGREGEIIEYRKLGLTEGYGSFHFSQDSLELMETLLTRQNSNRMVNSIFGEGVNPLMRKIRQALDQVGLPSDLVLRHGNQRVIYGVPLASNFQEILMGRTMRPHYIVPMDLPREKTELLGNYWHTRWLTSRLKSSPDILDRVAAHSLSYPIQHGAIVARPVDPNVPTLWN